MSFGADVVLDPGHGTRCFYPGTPYETFLARLNGLEGDLWEQMETLCGMKLFRFHQLVPGHTNDVKPQLHLEGVYIDCFLASEDTSHFLAHADGKSVLYRLSPGDAMFQFTFGGSSFSTTVTEPSTGVVVRRVYDGTLNEVYI